MKFKNILRLCMVGGFLVLGSAVEASGSLPTAEVVKILNGSGKVGESVTIAFDMEETAVGTRLGRQYGALGGARIGPYFLKAKPKGAAGDSTVMLKIETEVEFLGSDGKSLANGGVGAPEGSVIKERVTGWSACTFS